MSKIQLISSFEAEGETLLTIADDVSDFASRGYSPNGTCPAGYNIGMNCGEVADQTIPHFHCHVIPRYPGDTPHPRGGVRGVIPSRQAY